MKVFGLDFTSAPRSEKPITKAHCVFEKGILTLFHEIEPLTDFDHFEAFLNGDDQWIAGIDFPFGQPRKLVTDLSWPQTWEGYVQKIAKMKKEEFGELLGEYRVRRKTGDKQHKRYTDERAKSLSPMMWYGVPVGKMFFEGAPRLLQSKACVMPFRKPEQDRGIVVEAYPALVARKIIGHRRYKSDDKKKWTKDREAARQEVVRFLQSGELPDMYGFQVKLPDPLAGQLIHDATGDRLDAVLCAIQAAWAYSQKEQHYGIPTTCDRLEGWIVDPEMLSAKDTR